MLFQVYFNHIRGVFILVAADGGSVVDGVGEEVKFEVGLIFGVSFFGCEADQVRELVELQGRRGFGFFIFGAC